MHSNAGFNQDSPTSSPSRPTDAETNHPITPLTIKQLFSAHTTGEMFRIGNHQLSNVTFVGLIIQVNKQLTNTSFEINDGTGTIDVRWWIDPDDKSDYMQDLKNSWKENVYVRVSGHLRSFEDKRSIVAHKVQPISDFNEITYHFLDTIHVNLLISRESGSLNVAHQTNYFVPTANMSPLQREIYHAVRNSRSKNGVSVSEISAQVSQYSTSPDEIRTAIEGITREGHIYFTIEGTGSEDRVALTTSQPLDQ